MGLLNEIDDIIQNAKEWERVRWHLREVVTRPIFRDAFHIDPDDIDSEWIIRNFANLLAAAAKRQRDDPNPSPGEVE